MSWWHPRTWGRSQPAGEAAYESVRNRAYHETRLELARKAGRDEAVRESIGAASADPDADLAGNQNQALYRGIGGGMASGNDFDYMTIERHRTKVRKLAAVNPLGMMFRKLALDWVVGDCYQPRALPPEKTDDPQPRTNPGEEDRQPAPRPRPVESNGSVQDQVFKRFAELLEEFWTEPVNSLESEHAGMFERLFVEGEMLVPIVDINPIDGHLLIGDIPNDQLKGIILGRTGRPIVAFVTAPDASQKPLRYYLLNGARPEDEFVFFGDKVLVRRMVLDSFGVLVPKDEPYDGIAFYWTVNRVRGAARGKSELLPIADLLDHHDEMLWSFLERVKVLHHFLYHVTAEGLDNKAKIRAFLKEIGLDQAPEAAQIVATNAGVTIDAKSPNLSADPVERMERVVRTVAAGVLGIPEAWTGPGGEVNFATAKAQDTVPGRRMLRLQNGVLREWRALIDFQIREWKRKGTLPMEYDARYEIVGTAVHQVDVASLATAVKDLVAALMPTVDGELLTPELVRRIVVTVLRQAGFEVTEEEAEGPDPEEIAERQQAKQEEMRLKALVLTGRRDGGSDGGRDEGQQAGAGR